MTVEDKLRLKPGDLVRVRFDDGSESTREVKYSPWQVSGGVWVIGLKGISGGYSLERVIEIVSIAALESTAYPPIFLRGTKP